jgi:hypothetical protein
VVLTRSEKYEPSNVKSPAGLIHMPRVVPSQVIELIDSLFPDAKDERENAPLPTGTDHSTQLSAILELVQQIPPELIVLDGVQYAEYVASIAAIRWSIQRWQLQQKTHIPLPMVIRGLRQHSTVTLIRQALAKCPNEFPASGTSELSLIYDDELRERLRLDIGAVENAFANLEWKAATVLAGSVIEALLLWVLEEHCSDKVEDSVDRLVAAHVFAKPKKDLKYWDLYHYVEVAADLKAVEEDTVKLVRLAKDYRNLIHPGKAERLGQMCNRATAMTAISALDRVTENLTKKFGHS